MIEVFRLRLTGHIHSLVLRICSQKMCDITFVCALLKIPSDENRRPREGGRESPPTTTVNATVPIAAHLHLSQGSPGPSCRVERRKFDRRRPAIPRQILL